MDNRPLGIFDSGIGGLTCVKEIERLMPNEKILYFGDTARAPYGSKNPEILRQYALEICNFLVRSGVKAIVIACNTISAIAIEDIKRAYPDIPVTGTIDATADECAVQCKKKSNVGIIATHATIQSGAYERAIAARADLNVFTQACPAFVPLIEEGITEEGVINPVIRSYLDGFIRENKIDTLVLGCTHYPIISKNISECCPGLNIISSSECIAKALTNTLDKADMRSDEPPCSNTFCASDLTESFVKMTELVESDRKYELMLRKF